jgi:hypothetical protein
MDDDHENEGAPKSDHCRDRGGLKGEIDRFGEAAWPLRDMPRWSMWVLRTARLFITFAAAGRACDRMTLYWRLRLRYRTMNLRFWCWVLENLLNERDRLRG